jgi:predicted nucleic acid-binding protein
LILLNTNVLSEALRPAPAASVVNWLNVHFSECAISSIAIFELGAGIAVMAKGKRREALEAAIVRMIRRFSARVYAFDALAASVAVKIMEGARKRGLGLHQIPQKLPDLQIAGIASAYGLALATRNIADFQGAGLTLIDPWASEG